MTLTIADDFTSITVQSSILDSYQATPSNYTEVKITAYINCCDTTVYEKVFTSNAGISTDGEYVIDKDFFEFAEDVLPDGVYQFSVSSVDITSTASQQSSCILLDNLLHCQVLEFTVKNPDSTVYMLHYLLTQSSDCNCYCSDMCILLDRIVYMMDMAPTVPCGSETTNGCSSC